ncbi:MAG: hypothetical protein L0G27_08065 [Paracoccus sp. (in: a-proteobacteria)]|nr:hypothetical protein [Paracoccus sp. (in: a-proteobacteria)]
MTHISRLALPLLLTLAACGSQGDYPDLLPTSQLLAEPVVPNHAQVALSDPAPVEAAANARADALRARAQGLKGPVVDQSLRDAAMR